MGFSYDLIDSEESKAIYQQMLKEDTDRVLAWRAAKPQRQHLPIDGLFTAWWINKGPTKFATGADAVRYRGELLAHVKFALTEPVIGVDPAVEGAERTVINGVEVANGVGE